MDSAKAAMAAATSDPSSVTAAQAIVDAYVKAAPHTTAAQSHAEAADTTTATETSSADSVAQLYAGYLSRAPDPAGAAYWTAQLQGGASLDQVSQAFAAQTEAASQSAFLANPDVTDATAVKGFVDAIYSNLFSRAADADGEAYWTAQLQSGASTIGGAVLSIASGAQGSDLVAISNKVAVANYLDAQIVSNNVAFSMDSAKAAMAAVTSDPSSVTAAQSIVDAYVKTAPHTMADGSPTEVTVVGVSASHDPGHSV